MALSRIIIKFGWITPPAMRDRACDRIMQGNEVDFTGSQGVSVGCNSQQAPSFELINADGLASLWFREQIASPRA